MAGAELEKREDRPAYVRFERVAVEDKKASIEQRKYVAKDVDFALITPPYSKDVVRVKVDGWFQTLDQDVRNGRISREWVEDYRKAYDYWLKGQEIPLNGTPIRGWSVISPAQQEMLIKLHILTVEDLAQVNDEGSRRVGMGATELKNKAGIWLKQSQDKGPLTIEMAALQQKCASQQAEIETLKAQVKALLDGAEPAQVIEQPASDVSEILDEPAPVRRGPGRPRKDAA